MAKDFDNWNIYKKSLDNANTIQHFSEREIWWTSIGMNLGQEQDGKNKKFNRPVLVLKKFNNRLFWGIPLSSNTKENPYYCYFTFKNNQQSAMLSQMRLFDAIRITERMGKLSENDFESIKKSLIRLIE